MKEGQICYGGIVELAEVREEFMRWEHDGCGNPTAVDPANGDILSLTPYPTIRLRQKGRCACTIVSLRRRTEYCDAVLMVEMTGTIESWSRLSSMGQIRCTRRGISWPMSA